MNASRNEVQSLQRALDILEVIGTSAKPVSLKEVTQAANLPKSTVYRLLNNLEGRDYVRCDSHGCYQLGFKVMMLGQRLEQNFELKELIRPFLQHLNEVTRETVHLGILAKERVVYIDTMESPHNVRLVAKIGSTNSVHCTSLGKALLVGHSDDSIAEILERQGMEQRTEFTLTTPQSYLAQMRLGRERGYFFDDRESDYECCCVGAPVYNHKGEAVAAISISGPFSRFTHEIMQEAAIDQLLEVVSQISGYLRILSK